MIVIILCMYDDYEIYFHYIPRLALRLWSKNTGIK